MKREKLKEISGVNSGITLIALVITIVVMLILAGVTINLTMGEQGIFTTAKEAGENFKISEYKDKVELARANVSINNMGEVTIDNLIAQIYKENVVPQNSITKIDEQRAKMSTNEGYIFVITVDNVQYVGLEGKIDKPIITQVSKTYNTATIRATDIESGIIGYAITNTNEEPTNFTACNLTKDLNVTVNELNEDTKYYVWVKNNVGYISESTTITTDKGTDYYVKDGLIAHFDGIYNTRSGNNPNSTTWEDLSGNNNDAVGYNMATENGYYSEEEKGYVFLENGSYFKTMNNIGISRR